MAWVAAISNGFLDLVFVVKFRAVSLPALRMLNERIHSMDLAPAGWANLLAKEEIPEFSESSDVEFVDKHLSVLWGAMPTRATAATAKLWRKPLSAQRRDDRPIARYRAGNTGPWQGTPVSFIGPFG